MSQQGQRTIQIIKYESDELHRSAAIFCPYARYSTDNQANTSTEDQHRRIKRAASFGDIKSKMFPKARIELGPEFKDEAITGVGTVGRDGLNACLAEIREGRAQGIAVDDFKRFIRDMGSSLQLYDFLQDHSAELYSVSDGFSSAEPGARLKFMNKAYASEEFLDTVSRDTKRGLNERRYEGFSDGHLWFGVGSKATRTIQMKGKEKESHHDYFVIEHLAQIIRRIFEMYNDGLSDKALAKQLNAEGTPPPQCWDRKTGVLKQQDGRSVWKDKTIWHILNNRAYIGIIERGKTKIIRRNDGTKKVIAVPREEWVVIERNDLRIVPQDLWDAVRAKIHNYHIEKNQSGVGAGRPFKYDGTTNKLLTGICKCHKCGVGFVQVSGKHGGRYGCPTSRKSGACDNRKTVSWRKLEGTIIKWLLEQLKSEEVFALIASKYNKLLAQRLSGESRELTGKETQLQQVEGQIHNIIANMKQGLVSPSVTSHLHDLELQKQKLEAQVNYLQGLNKSQVLMTPSGIRQRFDEVPKLLREKTPHEVNRVLKSLFKGRNEIVLVPRVEGGKEDYWAVGKLNLGGVLGIAAKLTGEYTPGEAVSVDIPFDLKVGGEE